MAYERFVLVVDEEAGSLGELAVQLVRLGLDALYTNQRDEAALLAGQESRRIGALLLHSSSSPEIVSNLVASVGARAGLSMGAVILIGPKPDHVARQELRKLGVRWWTEAHEDPVTLRSLVSFVVAARDEADTRIEPRVPAALLAEISVDGQATDARVRNLSVGGAFLELDEPLDEGRKLSLVIALADEHLQTEAEVRYVLRNADDRTLPAGNGVSFVDLDLATQAILRRFLAEEVSRYRL